MKKWGLAATAGICILAVLLTVCTIWKMDTDKIRDIDYTTVDKDDIPEELKEQIEKKKGEEMRIYYGEEGSLYAVRGYGRQETGGYSIRVLQCYEAEHAVYIETELLGPDHAEERVQTGTCPYVVIRMEYMDKQIVFE